VDAHARCCPHVSVCSSAIAVRTIAIGNALYAEYGPEIEGVRPKSCATPPAANIARVSPEERCLQSASSVSPCRCRPCTVNTGRDAPVDTSTDFTSPPRAALAQSFSRWLSRSSCANVRTHLPPHTRAAPYASTVPTAVRVCHCRVSPRAATDETCASPRLPLGRPRTFPISISLRLRSRSRSRLRSRPRSQYRPQSPPPDQLWYTLIPLLPPPVHLTSRRVRSEYSTRHLFHPSYIMPGMPPMPSSIPAIWPSSFSFTSVIRADVVITDAAIEHELSTACCVTVAGSITPVSSKFS